MKNIILLLIIVLITLSGTASGETGIINVLSSSNFYAYGYTGTAYTSVNINYSMFLFDVANYRTISRLRIGCVGNGMPTGGNYTTFTILPPNTGYGTAYWDSVSTNVTWTFSETTNIVSSPVYVQYAQNIFTGFYSNVGRRDGGVSITKPMYLANMDGTQANQICDTSSPHETLFVGTYTNVSYNVTYPQSGFYKAEITKYVGSIATKIFIHSSTVYQLNETTFNTNYLDFYGAFLDGLYFKVTVSAGGYNDVLINASGAPGLPISPPTIDPITGVGIQFDQTDYPLESIANISWVRTISTPFLDTDSIVLIHPDSTEEELITSPPDSGFIKTKLSLPGTWKVEFRRSSVFFGVSILNSDTATVQAEKPSYLLANSTVISGISFNATYLFGYTPQVQGELNSIIIEKYDNGVYNAYKTTSLNKNNIVANTEYNVSLIVGSEGKYKLTLFDVAKGRVGTPIIVTAISGFIPPTTNITASYILLDDTSYFANQELRVSYGIDNTNYSNGTLSKFFAIYYLNGSKYLNIAISGYGIQLTEQSGVFRFPLGGSCGLDTSMECYEISLLAGQLIAGAYDIRLIGRNGTTSTDYILAHSNFTIEKTNIYGYGLEIYPQTFCKTGMSKIEAFSPSTNSSVTFDFTPQNSTRPIRIDVLYFDTNRTWNYQFGAPGDYKLSLIDNLGTTQFVKYIKVSKTCEPEITTTTVPTTPGGETIINTLIWLATNAMIWTIAITLGIMILVSELTKPNATLPVIVSAWASLSVAAVLGAFPLWIPIGMLLIAVGLIAAKIINLFNTGGGDK